MAARSLTQKRYQDALIAGETAYNKLLEEQGQKQTEIKDLQERTDDAAQLRLKNAQEELDILEQQTKAAKLYVDTIKQGAEGNHSLEGYVQISAVKGDYAARYLKKVSAQIPQIPVI